MNSATAGHVQNLAEPPTLRFSTDQFRAGERLVAWREFVGRTFCRAEIEPLSPEGFIGLNTMRMLPGLGVITGNCSPLRYVQTRELSDSDDVILSSGSGPWQLDHAGKSTGYAPGDAVLTSAGGLGSYTFHTGGPHWGLRVPFKLLSPLIANMEDTFGRRIPAQTPALRLLRHYLGIIKELDSPNANDVRPHAAAQIRDLIALAVGATRDGAETAKARGVRTARLREIKADIAANIGREDLSVATIASRHRLPLRYVQRLFEEDGATFTQFLLEQRLIRAREILVNPRFAHFKVSMVAIEAGFSNMSYFYESFRRRYGGSPSDMRAQARYPD